MMSFRWGSILYLNHLLRVCAIGPLNQPILWRMLTVVCTSDSCSVERMGPPKWERMGEMSFLTFNSGHSMGLPSTPPYVGSPMAVMTIGTAIFTYIDPFSTTPGRFSVRLGSPMSRRVWEFRISHLHSVGGDGLLDFGAAHLRRRRLDGSRERARFLCGGVERAHGAPAAFGLSLDDWSSLLWWHMALR